ncbi:class I SAM-dependent methyltransferase [Rathayibacter toxicus]|uniref:class I SAM-dependent methyltransferase n=1 Tax=Rathayibacter toxicus TaxID=145458 RepID=UPI001C057BDF|nr:class I SAM-dependent methyltransferase [Rathayibacter toxicus]QWL27333.1 class I SAM-dependent methyltransferase [Rathayibacter toxicus]
MTEYWNHNTAYHRELLAAAQGQARVLDIGCGDGLLLHKLSAIARQVVGIDSDALTVSRARKRLAPLPNTEVILGDVMTAAELDGQHFTLIACVATLHHLPLEPALTRLRELLAPGGQLRIVGLAAHRTIGEWLLSTALILPLRLLSALHRESTYPEMVTAKPDESLADIRRAAATLLPGSRIRRRLYYRYTLTWTAPPDPDR